MKRKLIAGVIALLIIVLMGFGMFSKQEKSDVKVGDKVPVFELPDQDGNLFNIKDQLGQEYLIIYFYPKDDTPGCTKQACGFRDSMEEFENIEARIIGISSDSVESHREFADKYKLPFTLLADTESKVRSQFGVKKDLLGLIPGRSTYIVDKKGVIIYVYNNQFKSEKHIELALEFLKDRG